MDIRNQKMGVGKKAYTHRRLPLNLLKKWSYLTTTFLPSTM
jgi:hypothetical protein